MRWRTSLAVALSVAACHQTVVLDQHDGGGGGGGAGGSPTCPGPRVDFDVEWPQVIVALDRSAGMSARFGTGDGTVLTAARDAIGVYAARYQKVVKFGYVEFPGSGNVCDQAGCCASDPSFPTLSFAAFELALHACDQPSPACPATGYLRPTTPALTSSALLFAQPSPVVNRYVLLVTNGRPDCGMGQNAACTEAQNIIVQMAASDVATVVVAPGPLDLNDEQCLERMAAYGGADNPPYFHPASSPAELAARLADIIRDMARGACHLDVTPRIQDPDRVVLRWKDTPIPRNRNDVEGWALIQDGYEIVLHGEWCDRMIDGAPTDFALYTDCEPQN